VAGSTVVVSVVFCHSVQTTSYLVSIWITHPNKANFIAESQDCVRGVIVENANCERERSAKCLRWSYRTQVADMTENIWYQRQHRIAGSYIPKVPAAQNSSWSHPSSSVVIVPEDILFLVRNFELDNFPKNGYSFSAQDFWETSACGRSTSERFMSIIGNTQSVYWTADQPITEVSLAWIPGIAKPRIKVVSLSRLVGSTMWTRLTRIWVKNWTALISANFKVQSKSS